MMWITSINLQNIILKLDEMESNIKIPSRHKIKDNKM